eukprot:363451-Chlamydomonas_euryale.AAC.15
MKTPNAHVAATQSCNPGQTNLYIAVTLKGYKRDAKGACAAVPMQGSPKPAAERSLAALKRA